MEEQDEPETMATMVVPLSAVEAAEAGAPPKISPFGGSPATPAPAASAPEAPAPAPAATADSTTAPAASAPEPPAPAPAASADEPTTTSAPSTAAPKTSPHTIRLKPVIRKPMIRKPMAPAARPPAATAATTPKAATGNLKSVTGPIPAQAILRKTGIVAEGILTPAQAQASKSKTSRISLESAIGVAPAKEQSAPLKTIRLRRPTGLKPSGPSPLKPTGPSPLKPEPSPIKPATPETNAPESAVSIENQPTLVNIPRPEVSTDATTVAEVSQKKTLKLRRPGVSGKRPALGINRPTATAVPTPTPTVEEVPELPTVEVAASDDVPELKPLTASDFGAATKTELSAGVPKWVMTLSIITTIAALAVAGFVAFLLIQEGCGPDAGANSMAFIMTN